MYIYKAVPSLHSIGCMRYVVLVATWTQKMRLFGYSILSGELGRINSTHLLVEESIVRLGGVLI